MKKKELKKKFVLKKETISALTKKESSNIKGGFMTRSRLNVGPRCGPDYCVPH